MDQADRFLFQCAPAHRPRPGRSPSRSITEPVDTEPVDTEPVDTEPVDTERGDADPVEVEPVAEPNDEAPDLENVPSAEQPTEPLLVDTLDESVFAPEIEPTADPIAIEDAEPELRVPLRPGPGLIPRRVERPRTEEVAAPFWDEAWEEPPIEEEPHDDLPPDADSLRNLEHLPAEVTERGQRSPKPRSRKSARRGDDPDVEAVELVTEVDHPIFADEALSAPAPSLPVGVEETEVEESAFPVPVEQLAVVAANDQTLRPQMVVDLDHLHVDQASLEPDLELLFAGAPAPEGEKSGLLGAVRSAFARNKTSHEHEFVEAPGGIGIVRQICAECGYISIGVAD